MATIKQQVEERAAELGVTIEVTTGRYDRRRLDEIELCAPDGYHMLSNNCHYQICPGGEDTPTASLWADALDMLSYGVEACSAETPCDDWSDCDANQEAE